MEAAEADLRVIINLEVLGISLLKVSKQSLEKFGIG
jgi:hypothetical protein